MSRSMVLAMIVVALVTPDEPRPARDAPAIRFQPRSAASQAVVDVVGIDRENLDALAQSDWDQARWAELLAVTIESNAIPGRCVVVGDVLRFTPKFSIEPGLMHRARFDPRRLPIAMDGASSEITFTQPLPPPSEPSRVVRVEPSVDVVPENLLKLYLHFSAPMSRGEVYRRVHLLNEHGAPIVLPFLEIGEELWDRTETRLTLLFDPGRIKRGLIPREEDGPILEAGKTYTLIIDREWPDAHDQPMRESFRKTFRAGPADVSQPDPARWTVSAPFASTCDLLTMTFPEPLDHAMLGSALVVFDDLGREIKGRVAIEAQSTRWAFRPAQPWVSVSYRL